jgi:hypothetical protein
VIVPAALCAPAQAQALRWVLTHELTHLRRRDAWSCLLFGLGQAVYFYVPWFWALRRRVRLCQEFIADAAVVRDNAPAPDYAQFLLGLLEAPAVPVPATGALGKTSDLFRRIAMLLDDSARTEDRYPRRWSVVAAAGLLILALTLSGLGLKSEAASVADPSAAANPGADPKDEPKKDENQPGQDKRDPGSQKALQQTDIDNLQKKLERLGKASSEEEFAKAKADLERALKFLYSQRQAEMDRTRRFLESWQEFGQARDELADQQKALLGLQELKAKAQDDYRRYLQEFATSEFRPYLVGQGRLGVQVQTPTPALADQLDLPNDSGLLITHVAPDSAAAKAGLKVNDILLEIDGHPVTSNPGALVKLLQGIKADSLVAVVILRKGKKEAIKGLPLPEAKTDSRFPGGVGAGPILNYPTPGNAKQGVYSPPNMNFSMSGNGVMTTLFRTDDRFTTRHQEGSLVITVTGTVADGKAKIKEIHVQDGRDSHKYESADKVPERYADKIKNLVEMSEKGSVRVEIKESAGPRDPNKRGPSKP